jgi:hypothetical protein
LAARDQAERLIIRMSISSFPGGDLSFGASRWIALQTRFLVVGSTLRNTRSLCRHRIFRNNQQHQ